MYFMFSGFSQIAGYYFKTWLFLRENSIVGKAVLPARLAEKLLRIREKLGLSQTEMCAAIQKQNSEITMYRSYIAQYEAGRVPGPLTLLTYSKIARISLEQLVDDKLDLPAKYK